MLSYVCYWIMYSTISFNQSTNLKKLSNYFSKSKFFNKKIQHNTLIIRLF